MHANRWTAVGALGIALLFVLGAFLVLPSPVLAPSGTASVGTAAPSLAEQMEVARGIEALSLDKVPASGRGQAAAFLAGLTPAQKGELEYIAAANSSLGYEVLSGTDLHLACGFFGIGCNLNWGSIGVAAFGGCLVGGALGSGAGGIGAAPGCAIGAATFALTDAFGQETANSQSNSAEEQMMALLMQTTLNQFNETGAFMANAISELNATLYFMETVADSAAVSQIGNTSFNPGLDIAQTPLGYYVNSVMTPFEVVNAKIAQIDQAWLYANYGPGAQYSGSSGNYYQHWLMGCTGGTVNGACAVNTNLEYQGSVVMSAAATNSYVYIATGATFYVPASCTLTSADRANPPLTGALGVDNFSSPSDVYLASAACADLSGYGIVPVYGFPSSSIVMQLVGAYNDNYPADGTGAAGGINGGTRVDMCGASTCGNSGGFPDGLANEYGAWTWGPRVIQAMTTEAAENAQVYWAYLRALGYTNANQIPPNCAIPMPAFALPAELADGIAGDTVPQLMGIYESWLNSLSTFFDTPPNTTSFCKGHPIYQCPECSPYGYDVNITGFIYAPGMVWAGAGFKAGSPQLGTTSTWSFNGASPPVNGKATTPIYMTGWPLEATVKIPIGSVYEVPSNDPLVIIPTQFYAWLTLHGNGTDVNVSQSGQVVSSSGLFPAVANNTTAGDALYISTCEVNGTFYNTTCPLTFATIKTVTGNQSCGTGSNGACQNTTAGFYSGINFCGWFIISTLCSLFGGAFVNGIMSFIILVVIAVIAIYAVLYVLGRRSGKSGGGANVSIVEGRGGAP